MNASVNFENPRREAGIFFSLSTRSKQTIIARYFLAKNGKTAKTGRFYIGKAAKIPLFFLEKRQKQYIFVMEKR